MSLEGHSQRVDPGDIAQLTPRFGSDDLPNAWLMRLGPVLLVRDATCLGVARCFHSCAIDSSGVRETLHFHGHRIHRLADSDYYAWEHVAAICRAGAEVRQPPSRPSPRRAHVVRSIERSWQPVTQLSALGWRQVDEILHWERARLEPLDPDHAARWRG